MPNYYQYFVRSYPLLRNYENDNDDHYSLVRLSTPNHYHNPIRILFLTEGTAVDGVYDVEDREDHYAIRDNDEYGVPNLKLENNSKIVGKFH